MSLDISSSADSFDDDSFEEEPDELSEPEESSEEETGSDRGRKSDRRYQSSTVIKRQRLIA